MRIVGLLAVAFSSTAIAVSTPTFSNQPGSWRDPSPHKVQFVTVEKDVRLEVLDWGGVGKPVVLLAGGGNTAHVYDEFAPKLAAHFRVYGITRRGFGASTYGASEADAARLGEDVVAVVRALGIKRPVLVGHSIAGAELSSVAAQHPDSIAGVVYLEAAYPYAFDNGTGPTMKEFLDIHGPQAPEPRPEDLASFNALQKWDARVYGFRLPESEFHQTWEAGPDGRPVKPREFQGSQVFMKIMASTKKFDKLDVPSLVIFAIPHIRETWMLESTDPAVRTAGDEYFVKLDALATKQAQVVRSSVPGTRVVIQKGMHYIFLTNEGDVLREIRAFVDRLE